jgi:hypothetical protein
MLLSDFMQVQNRRRKHYTKNEYVPMHLLFTTIYLLQEHKLNINKYYEKEINMGKNLQSIEHDVHMYAKIQGLKLYGFV